MLPFRTITPDISSRTGSLSKHFSKPANDAINRSKRSVNRSSVAPAARQAATTAVANVAPRKSLDKTPVDNALTAPGLQTYLLDADGASSSSPDLQQAGVSASVAGSHSDISHSTSATSLSSDSELAMLLNGADLSRPGTTTINIGSIPIAVPIAYLEVPAEQAEAQPQPASQTAAAAEAVTLSAATDDADAATATKASKLKATSAEFYPRAYLAAAAAAATVVAAQSLSSSSNPSGQNSPAVEEVTAAESEDEQQPAVAAHEEQQEQQQTYWQAEAEQQQQPEMAIQPWQQQQQAWQQWQQQPVPMAVPMFFPVPVPVPPYMMPGYPYAYQQMQQHMGQLQLHPVMHRHQQQMAAAAAAAAAAESSSTAPSTPAPLSPAPSLPADSSSLLSTPTAAGWALAHSSSLYGGSSTRPGSSASSVASGYSSRTGRQRQQQQQAAALRDAGTVTVSALSCVKDAAGALAKVVSRHGSCLLLSLTKPGDQAAQATHVAAKSLAVARFYVNAHMAAAGAAGIDAAAVLTGLEPATPNAAAAAAGDSDEEVVFMPFDRNSNAAPDAEPALGFLVAKASAADLPVQLPPPVGIPACMQDRQQQQQQQGSGDVSRRSSSSGVQQQSGAPLLKAGAGTDVNKLSNAIIHNILGCSHVALQLAGAAACQVAMRALIKARARLQRKFNADIVATASFANEDTSSSIGRSTVFLRLDVMRSSCLQQLAAGAAGVGRAVAQAAGEMGAGAQQQQSLVGAV